LARGFFLFCCSFFLAFFWLRVRKRRVNKTILARMPAILCVESHLLGATFPHPRSVDLHGIPLYSPSPSKHCVRADRHSGFGGLGREHKMRTSWRRFSLACVSVVCLALPACMQVPFCAPELSYVAPVALGTAGTEVHAFRVDVTEKTVVNIDEKFKSAGGGVSYYELTPMPLSTRGTTSLQWDVSWAYGWRSIGLWNYWPTLTTHSVAVRLYRRGFDTAELRPGKDGPDDWTKVTDLAAQEKAVDDLLGVSPLETTSPLKPVRGTGSHSPPALELGTKSAGQRQALLFAANEYEWLAHELTNPDPEEQVIRTRLLEKARRLQDLAKGKCDAPK
jgi:hypothetical protein